MEALRPYIQRIADEHIDAMLAGPQPADLVRDFSCRSVAGDLRDARVPYADRNAFQADSAILLNFEADRAISDKAAERMQNYLRELLTDKMARPQDDLLSRPSCGARRPTGR